MPVMTELQGTVTKSVPANEYRPGYIYASADGATFYIPADHIRGQYWPKVGDTVRFAAAPHRPGFNAEIVSTL